MNEKLLPRRNYFGAAKAYVLFFIALIGIAERTARTFIFMVFLSPYKINR